MRTRALLATATLALGAGAAALAVPSGASPGGGGCQLHGQAKFVKGPNSTPHKFTYTFAGALTNCQDDSGKAPASGSVATLKPATGSGTCQNGTTSGVALAKWADKTTTIFSYTTQDYGANVLLQGTVLGSYKVGKKVYRSNRYVGDSALATLAFEADPTQCAGSGVTTAGIDGMSGLGHN